MLDPNPLKTALQPAAHTEGGIDMPYGNRLITPSEIALRGVQGVTVRWRTHWPEDFIIIQSALTATRVKKHWTLLEIAGKDADLWTLAKNLAERVKWCKRHAVLFENDPLLWGIHCALPPHPHSEEVFYERPWTKDQLNAQFKMIDVHAEYYPDQYLLFALAAKDQNAIKAIVDYVVKHKLQDRFILKSNAMSAKLPKTSAIVLLLQYAAKAGCKIGFEMLTDCRNTARIGGDFVAVQRNIAVIEKFCGAKFHYQAWYKGDLKRL